MLVIFHHTECISQAILQQIPEQKSIGRRFLDLLKGFHPVITYDSLSGIPEVSFKFAEQKEAEKTLSSIYFTLNPYATIYSFLRLKIFRLKM